MLRGLFKNNIGLLSGSGNYQFKDPGTGKQLKVYYYKPEAFHANTPVAIVLHGRKRNAETYRDDWQKLAENHKLMVLVPLFSNANYPGGNGFNLGNVFLARNETEERGFASSGIKNPVEKWSYSVPDRVFADFKQRVTSQQPGYTLYGHGGGSQFAMRFALMLPNRHACRVIAANPGWYTYPDRSVAWPYGIGGVDWVNEAQIDRFLRNPLFLMLGDDDTKTGGIMRDTDGAKAQGRNRKERGQRFFDYAQTLAKKDNVNSGWQLLHVPHAGHSDAQMSGAAAGHITPCT